MTLYLAVEGFACHPDAERAISSRNILRPHIGRALSVASQVQHARDEGLVRGLELTGVGAAIIGANSRLRAVLAKSSNALLPDASLLRLLFDLTPAEARVARFVTEGFTLDEIATKSGTSKMTVRTQLRSVFAKTGVSRQLELVRLLMGVAGSSNV